MRAASPRVYRRQGENLPRARRRPTRFDATSTDIVLKGRTRESVLHDEFVTRRKHVSLGPPPYGAAFLLDRDWDSGMDQSLRSGVAGARAADADHRSGHRLSRRRYASARQSGNHLA